MQNECEEGYRLCAFILHSAPAVSTVEPFITLHFILPAHFVDDE
jgi:hypothetical protein